MGARITLDWELPEGAVDKAFERELSVVVKEEVALRLFREGKVSSGYAAALLGTTRRAFLALLKKRGMPFVQYTFEDLKADQKAFERATEQAQQSRKRA
jgi:predicted HTH domain antitoxin